jgi:DNA-binding IclR family transcriptional regulator
MDKVMPYLQALMGGVAVTEPRPLDARRATLESTGRTVACRTGYHARDISTPGVLGVSGRNSEAGRSVLDKAFAVLDALREAQVDLTRAQLARRTGLPMTTVHRLATELCEHGALELTEHKTYRVGPWLWEIGTLSAHTRTFRYAALPFMQDLYEATHENVQLAVPDGFDALVVERVRGRTSVRITSRVGGRLPLHSTGVGKAILAFSSPEFQEAVIARGLLPMTPYTITDPQILRRELAETRERGYSVTRMEMGLNSASVGVPIVDTDDIVLGAISLIVEASRADVARLAPPIKAVARGISRQLAARDR